MSLAQAYQHAQGGPFQGDPGFYWNRNHDASTSTDVPANYSNLHYGSNFSRMRNFGDHREFSRNCREYNHNYDNFYVKPEGVPSSSKKRKFSSTGEGTGTSYEKYYAFDKVPFRCSGLYGNASSNVYNPYTIAPSTYENYLVAAPTASSDANACSSTSHKRNRSLFEEGDDDILFFSRDEIERFSPSRKDGIDAMHETHLRYSYCTFLQNLGLKLEMPQTTIATAMVLCHRFFVRRSHACHDRFLIATASLFLAAKSEETSRPLYNVLRASCEILHNKDFTFLSYMLPVDWFEQYRERVIEAEEMILTTLNFELDVQHPYESLTSTLEKLGFSQSFLVNLAISLVSEGIYRRISVLASLIFLAGG